MYKIRVRRLDSIGDGAEAEADTEDIEEEGIWEGMERTETKGYCTGRGGNDYDCYSPPNPEYEAEASLSDSEPEIPFTFGPRYAG